MIFIEANILKPKLINFVLIGSSWAKTDFPELLENFSQLSQMAVNQGDRIVPGAILVESERKTFEMGTSNEGFGLGQKFEARKSQRVYSIKLINLDKSIILPIN